ncbi:MAG TPA: hypothetical protein VJT83_03960 [Chitinophagaceae bacterium]|nr:hypothetical protein [Chitinophagaceae bacterium]
MKKIFGLLISIWIPLYLLFALLSSCTKSTLGSDKPQLTESTPLGSESVPGKNPVLGSWVLVEYFEDHGDGSGQWITVKDPIHEDINFYADGSFLANSEFPVFKNQNYNHYTIVDGDNIDLTSSQTGQKATFHYVRESETSLLFHPLCRENCSRRYKLIK